MLKLMPLFIRQITHFTWVAMLVSMFREILFICWFLFKIQIIGRVLDKAGGQQLRDVVAQTAKGAALINAGDGKIQ